MSSQSQVPTVSQASPSPGQPVRSEALLPADPCDPDLQVAEEVSFDLQSDEARRIGALPPDTAVSKPNEALAESLKPKAGNAALKQAIEGAVPPSPAP